MNEIIPAPDWLVERMDKVSKMLPPTEEEVKTQLSASAAQRAILDEIPVVDQKTFAELVFTSKPLPFTVNMEKCKWRKR